MATGRLLCAPPCVCTALCVHRLVCEPPNRPVPPPYLPPVPPPPPYTACNGAQRTMTPTLSPGQRFRSAPTAPRLVTGRGQGAGARRPPPPPQVLKCIGVAAPPPPPPASNRAWGPAEASAPPPPPSGRRATSSPLPLLAQPAARRQACPPPPPPRPTDAIGCARHAWPADMQSRRDSHRAPPRWPVSLTIGPQIKSNQIKSPPYTPYPPPYPHPYLRGTGGATSCRICHENPFFGDWGVDECAQKGGGVCDISWIYVDLCGFDNPCEVMPKDLGFSPPTKGTFFLLVLTLNITPWGDGVFGSEACP